MQKTANRGNGRRAHTAKETGTAPLSFAKILIQTTGLALLLGALLTALLSLAIYFAPDPMTLIRPAGLAAAGVSALFSGMHFQRKMRGGILTDGMAAGLALMAPMLLLSLAFGAFASNDTPLMAGLLHALLPVLSIFGAWMGEKKQSKAKRKKRR